MPKQTSKLNRLETRKKPPSRLFKKIQSQIAQPFSLAKQSVLANFHRDFLDDQIPFKPSKNFSVKVSGYFPQNCWGTVQTCLFAVRVKSDIFAFDLTEFGVFFIWEGKGKQSFPGREVYRQGNPWCLAVWFIKYWQSIETLFKRLLMWERKFTKVYFYKIK